MITVNGNWYHEAEMESITRFAERQKRRFAAYMFSPTAFNKSRERHEKNIDNRKWAWIVVGKTRKLCWVDNVTHKAYKSDGYRPTWMEIKKFTFERWATGFDL